MRGKHLVASGAVALALASRPAALRADDADLALASRPFSLGELSVERTINGALRVGQFECVGCTEAPGLFTVVAWDVSAVFPLADDAAVFVLQPILFRSGGGGESHRFPGALTIGGRHVGSAGPALELAAAVSVSMLIPGGSKAEVTTEAAGLMVDDRSVYRSGLGTFRVELDARRQWSALFVQAQLALAVHSQEEYLLGSSRAGLGAGVQLLGRAALLAELTSQLGTGELACDECSADRPWEGPSRLALSVGGRVALPAGWALGVRGFLPLTVADGQERRPSLSATADARF